MALSRVLLVERAEKRRARIGVCFLTQDPCSWGSKAHLFEKKWTSQNFEGGNRTPLGSTLGLRTQGGYSPALAFRTRSTRYHTMARFTNRINTRIGVNFSAIS